MRPETGPNKPAIVPSLLFALPNSEFDLMLTSARDTHDAKYSFVNFFERAKGKAATAAAKLTPAKRLAQQERLASLAATLRILYALLRYGDRAVRQLVTEDADGQNGLLDPRIIHLILYACAKEDFGLSADEQKQKFGIPFKLLAIIEELIHIPAYTSGEVKRMVTFCEVVLASLSDMMRGVIFLLERRANGQDSGLISSDHPTQARCA